MALIAGLKTNLCEFQNLTPKQQDILREADRKNCLMLDSYGHWIDKPSPYYNEGKIYRLKQSWEPI